jgi:ribosomal protein L40E
LNSWSKKESKGLLPSDDPNLAKEIDKQAEELESIKNWGVDDSGPVGKSGVEIRYFEDGNIQSAVIDPWSATLNNNEQLLWNFDITKGFFRIKIIERLALSNYRIMRIDMQNNKVLGFILLPNLDDVVVMNTHRVSESVGYAFYMGRYTTMAGPRFSSGTSKSVGDVVFIVNGQKAAWNGIPDPTGLKNFVKSLKKTMYDQVTKLENKSSRSAILCPECGAQNPKNSKFCNGCGKNLASVCTKCGKSNPLNSSYCGQCGFALQ